ncbi:MAG: KDO2-lipid lauroyltransferase [Solirubrobacterales bacterium]|jgi:lauroyl/myristoyl acyltransferase|nr:KDO2-lipid lauroyltransferase [Solirubrobacterales bacterium]
MPSSAVTGRRSGLHADLAQVGVTPEPPPMPGAPLRVRVKTSDLLHRVLPNALAVRLAEAHGRRLWKRGEGERDAALAAMDAVVAGTMLAADATRLARMYVIESQVHKALFWQPWKTAETDQASSAHLDQALGSGRPVLISSCHLGPYFHSMSVISSRGHIAHAVAGPWFFEEPTPDYWGRRLARWRKGVGARGELLVPSSGCFPILESLLLRGEIVRLHFDLPGSRQTRFLGKQVALASGSARLAFSTGALVLPVRARRAGNRVWTDVAAPLDPHGFTSCEALHDALAGVHEGWILQMPFALEDPHRPGAWEQQATASAWQDPRRPFPPLRARLTSRDRDADPEQGARAEPLDDSERLTRR